MNLRPSASKATILSTTPRSFLHFTIHFILVNTFKNCVSKRFVLKNYLESKRYIFINACTSFVNEVHACNNKKKSLFILYY